MMKQYFKKIKDTLNEPFIEFITTDGYDEDNDETFLTITRGHAVSFLLVVSAGLYIHFVKDYVFLGTAFLVASLGALFMSLIIK